MMPSQSALHAISSSLLFAAGAAGATSVDTEASGPRPLSPVQNAQASLQSGLQACSAFLAQKCERIIHGHLDLSSMVQLLALCSIIPTITAWRGRYVSRGEGLGDAVHDDRKASGSKKGSSELSTERPSSEANSTDPGLLKKHSTDQSYTTSVATYPSIRTFHRPHPQADKLPSVPTPLPLLVFVHGLGGSLAQFHPLLTSLVNVAPCLGIDLPGCGRSAFSPTSWSAYTTKALAELLIVVIRQYCAQTPNQGVILIGHSLGCSLSALIASSVQNIDVLALIGICPQATPPSDGQVALFEKLLHIPTPIFNIWRTWDRRGGTESASVTRFVGKEADIEVKKLQVRFNAQSKSAVWRRYAWGALPSRSGSAPERGLPGLEIWGGLRIPIFLVGGAGDGITKTDQIVKIGRALGKVERSQPCEKAEPDTGKEADREVVLTNEHDKRQSTISKTEVTVIEETLSSPPNVPKYSKTRRVLKTSILPAPASHGLLYDPATYRTLAGLIHTFLHEHVDTRLSLGWQLQHLSTEGKWDVKNLAKWEAVRPVSEPIAHIFRAMKTLREIDQLHSPEIFVGNWKGKIKAVVDISHESPVYDPKGLDEGGIEYHKFPTVSKIPPTTEEARDFIKLIDRLRTSSSTDQSKDALIGVHCHYGFNRTGFFICCYLIEREGYGVQQAIDAFAQARAPGIRHEHFLDQLFVRYCVGLDRAPTL